MSPTPIPLLYAAHSSHASLHVLAGLSARDVRPQNMIGREAEERYADRQTDSKAELEFLKSLWGLGTEEE